MQALLPTAPSDRAEFGRLFSWLRQLGIKETTPVDADAYWLLLYDLPFAAVKQAIVQAPASFPTFFPSAPALQAMAKSIAKTMRQTGAVAVDAKPAPPTREHRLPPDHPAMQLARSWEEESRRLGLDPDRATPPEIAQRRMSELAALLDGVGGSL